MCTRTGQYEDQFLLFVRINEQLVRGDMTFTEGFKVAF